jgi:hypothetical protein
MGARLSTSGIPDPPTKVSGQPLVWNGSAWVSAALAAAGLAASAVGSTQLASNAVTTAKITDANVTDAKIAAGVSPSKIAQSGATSGQALLWNGSAWAPGTVSGGGGVDPTIVNAKGDLFGASANDTPARVPAGTNGQVLTADSTQTPGVAFKSPNPGPLAVALSPQSTTYTPSNSTATAGSPLLVTGMLAWTDLTLYTEMRWTLLTTTPFSSGAKLRPQYSTDGGTTWNYFESSGTGFEMDGTVNDTASGLTAVVRKSAWGNIVSGAKGEVDIRLALYGQTGLTQGSIRACYLIFR